MVCFHVLVGPLRQLSSCGPISTPFTGRRMAIRCPARLIYCQTSARNRITLEHPSEQHDAWHQTSRYRIGTPWRVLLLALAVQTTPWRPTTTPSTRWYPASTHLYGSSWTSMHSQPTRCNASRGVSLCDRDQLKLLRTPWPYISSPATLEQLLTHS